MLIYLKGGERNVHPLFLQDGERIVQRPKNSYIPYPLPIFPNSYMLDTFQKQTKEYAIWQGGAKSDTPFDT